MLDGVVRHDSDVQSVHSFLSHDLVQLDPVSLTVGLLEELIGCLRSNLRILDHEEWLLQLKSSVELILVELLCSTRHLSTVVQERVLVG